MIPSALFCVRNKKHHAPGTPAAHTNERLLLLPSGPDKVHSLPSNTIHINTLYGMIIYFFLVLHKAIVTYKK